MPPTNGPAHRQDVRDEGPERRGYRGYAQHARVTHEQNRRDKEAGRLRTEADDARRQASDYAATGIELTRAGDRARAQQYHDAAVAWEKFANARADEAEAVLAGTKVPERILIDSDADFQRINDDVGTLAEGGVETGNVSALTGTDHPPSVDATRPYGQRGGLRPPLALHQADLERAMPRDADGNVVRTADPRQGQWFGLANDGGPTMDPTRGINCLDCSLSFYETWLHGRPRVSAPRTFDGYEVGDVSRPLDGEHDGPGRVEDLTGGRFQQFSPDVRHLDPATAQQAVYQGYTALHNQLLAGGHGSYAFIVNNWEGGGSHAWVAINQNGTILYVDPQQGRISENNPFYAHWGAPNKQNIVSIDALVLDGNGDPMPLDGRPQGMYSARPPIPPPTPTPAPMPPGPVAADAPPTTTPSVPVSAATPAPAPTLANNATYINRLHLLDGPSVAGATTAPAGSVPENSPRAESESGLTGGGRSSGPSLAGMSSSPGAPPTQPQPSGPPPHTPQDEAGQAEAARRVLVDLPRSQLASYRPLPTLGGADLPVQRGEDGLIETVQVAGKWVDVPDFVAALLGQRVTLWRELAADPAVSDISKGKIQPCVSVAVDRRTGIVSEGHNNLVVMKGQLHPVVRERIDAYLAWCAEHNEGKGLHPSDPGRHSEIYAVNELLWERQAAGLPIDPSVLSELRIDNYFPWFNRGTGKPAPCCANCTGIIRDVPCNAGKFLDHPPDEGQFLNE